MKTLDTDYWIRRFEQNQRNRPEPPWDAPLVIPEEIRADLVRSLQEFQLGDGGGPATLIAFDAKQFTGQSQAIGKIVEMWFNEEEEHSRLLGGMLERLGVESIEGHWSFSLFCLLRRRLGVRFELQILTLTELVSTSYYTLLRRHSKDPALRGVCALILRDESGHVRFHNDRLAAAGHSRKTGFGKLWAMQFWLCGFAAASVLWASHHPCIRGLGGTTREFYANVHFQISRFLGNLDRKAIAAKTEPQGLEVRVERLEQRLARLEAG